MHVLWLALFTLGVAFGVDGLIPILTVWSRVGCLAFGVDLGADSNFDSVYKLSGLRISNQIGLWHR